MLPNDPARFMRYSLSLSAEDTFHRDARWRFGCSEPASESGREWRSPQAITRRRISTSASNPAPISVTEPGSGASTASAASATMA